MKVFFLFFSNAKIKETNGALFASQCRFSLFFLFLLKIPSFVIVISLPLDFGYCYDMSTEYSVSCFIESCICVHIISNAMRYFWNIQCLLFLLSLSMCRSYLIVFSLHLFYYRFFFFHFVSFVISRGPPLFAGTDRKREEYVFYFLFSAGGKKTKQENRKRDTITRCCCPPHLIFPTFLLFVQFLFFFFLSTVLQIWRKTLLLLSLRFVFFFFQLSSFPYQSFYSFLPISSFSRLFCPCTEESLILFRACVLSRLISFVLFFLIIKRNRKRRKERKEDGTISHFVFCFGLLS